MVCHVLQEDFSNKMRDSICLLNCCANRNLIMKFHKLVYSTLSS